MAHRVKLDASPPAVKIAPVCGMATPIPAWIIEEGWKFPDQLSLFEAAMAAFDALARLNEIRYAQPHH